MKKTFVVALWAVLFTRCSSAQDVNLDSVRTRFVADLYYFDSLACNASDTIGVAAWDDFKNSIVLYVKHKGEYFSTPVHVDSAGEKKVMCHAYYFKEQKDESARKMKRGSIGGLYLPLSLLNDPENEYDCMYFNFLFDGMQVPLQRYMTVVHEAVHMWMTHHFVYPDSASGLVAEDIFQEYFAYTVAWHMVLEELPRTVQLGYKELVVLNKELFLALEDGEVNTDPYVVRTDSLLDIMLVQSHGFSEDMVLNLATMEGISLATPYQQSLWKWLIAEQVFMESFGYVHD